VNISNKIEEIRQKPEYIRVRYVWGAVAICMFFIIIIWVFSLGDSFSKIKPDGVEPLSNLKQDLEKLKNANESNPPINEMINSQNSNLSEMENTIQKNSIENQEIIPENINETNNKQILPKE
jgi:hypothetical protein